LTFIQLPLNTYLKYRDIIIASLTRRTSSIVEEKRKRKTWHAWKMENNPLLRAVSPERDKELWDCWQLHARTWDSESYNCFIARASV